MKMYSERIGNHFNSDLRRKGNEVHEKNDHNEWRICNGTRGKAGNQRLYGV
jgi:hypothetical protein